MSRAGDGVGDQNEADENHADAKGTKSNASSL